MGSPELEKELILYSPHKLQAKFHESKARFRVAALGRQAGKSTMCLNELVFRAWTNPNTKYWYLSPTYAQAKSQYRRMVGMLFGCGPIMLKKNQTELRVKLINNSEIHFKSAEVSDSLRGETLHGVVIDELREVDPGLWPMVIRPMLSTTGGWAAFISTPNGFDAFYDLFQLAKGDKGGIWDHFQAPSTCNPLFTIDEYEAARRDMSEGQFAQEILAEFRDITRGKAYLNFTQGNCLYESPFAKEPGQIRNPFLPIVVACDFNLSPMAWTLGQRRNDEFYWFDEVWLEGSHTQEAALELIEKVKDHKPGIVIVGDSTAKAGQRASAGQSDYDILFKILNDHGIKWTNETPDSNPPVKDRVNNVNAKLKAADGTIRMWLHPTWCPRLKKDLERVVWKSGSAATLDQSTDSTLTHSSDGIGYAVTALSPVQGVNQVGTLRVIHRSF